MSRDLEVSSIRELNNEKSGFVMFPSTNYRIRISIKWMMRADDSDFSGISVTMRIVIRMRKHRLPNAGVGRGV